MSVSFLLQDELDVSRGDLICHQNKRPHISHKLMTTVCWMSEQPLVVGQRLRIKHMTRTVEGIVKAIDHRVDISALTQLPTDELKLNDVGQVCLHVSQTLAFDSYEHNRTTGSLILIDKLTNDTVGAGMVTGPATDRANALRSDNITWHAGGLTREQRWRELKQHGATIWLTGLPASGKSTVGRIIEQLLVSDGYSAYLLDGDNLRHGLCGDLGFDEHDRAENVRRVGEVACLLADAGTVAIVSLVSPYQAHRDLARKAHERQDLPFFEVYVSTPLEECETRDPKGLYQRARKKEILQMTGIDAPYEEPHLPDVEIDTTKASAQDCAQYILDAIGLIQ
jgi:bifunctional enzyme CysN/CysC